MSNRNYPAAAEPGGVLLILVITISLSALAIWAIAKTTQAILNRFGLDLLTVLLWLGLAERHGDA